MLLNNINWLFIEMDIKKPLVLAYYLPQYHTIYENDCWWGKGFTEWTALHHAKMYYSLQKIRKPTAPFYEYELPNKQVMNWQASIAKKHSIDGFFMWDYWFGNGKKLLSAPKEFIRDNNLDFKYALIWANHSWYNKSIGKLLIEQKYLGVKDYTNYFYDCLSHFIGSNYIKIDNKPIFGIFMPSLIPDLNEFMNVFNKLAINEGFNGIYWVGENTKSSFDKSNLFDAIVNSTHFFSKRKIYHPIQFVKEQLIKRYNLNFLGPIKYSYKKIVSNNSFFDDKEIPVIFTGWDTTPRHSKRGTILYDLDIKNFGLHVENTLLYAKMNKTPLVIIKSWNEWAEGNLLEPDCIFGEALLDCFNKKFIEVFNNLPLISDYM